MRKLWSGGGGYLYLGVMSLKTDMSETIASFLTVMATSGSHSLHSARSFFSPSTYGGIYDIKFIHEVYKVKHIHTTERDTVIVLIVMWLV